MDIDDSEAFGSTSYRYTKLLDAIYTVDVKRTQRLLEIWVEQPFQADGKYNYVSVAAASDYMLPVLKVILEHAKAIDEKHMAHVPTRMRIQDAFSKAAKCGNIAGITHMFEMDWGECPQNYHIATAIRNAAESWCAESINEIVRLVLEQPEKVWPQKDIDLRRVLNQGLRAAVASSAGEYLPLYRLGETLGALQVAGADFNAQGPDSDTLMHYACKSGHRRPEYLKASVIEELLRPRFRCSELLWASNNRGQIPIFTAAEEATDDILAHIAAKTGSLYDIRDDNGNTPLHFAKSQGIATHLFHYGCDFGARNQNGETALHLRSCGGTVGVVKYIIDMSAVLSLPNYSSKSKWDRRDLARSIGTRYAVSNQYNIMSDSAIFKLKVSRVVNASTNRGWTPLMYASKLDVFEYLCTRGANLTARTELGWTILHLAISRREIRIIRFILDKMHVPDLKEALMAPARSKKYRDTTPNDRGQREHEFRCDDNPWTYNEIPLHWALWWRARLVEMLLEKARELSILDAMLEARDSNGATPLIRAISMNGWDTQNIVRVLIANGASLDAKDNEGRDRHWWAKEKGYYFTEMNEFRAM